MPSQRNEEDEKLMQWRHPQGMDVLKRLGIVERSNASISEGDDEENYQSNRSAMLSMRDDVPNGGNLMDDSDDNEFIFDRASLLRGRHSSSDDERSSTWFNNRRTHNMSESRRANCCRGFLAALAFFIVGLCVSIIGPTLSNLMTNTASLSSATSVVSANAFGAIIGIIMCAGCTTLLNTFCIIMFALPLCSITTLVVPWCTTLTSASMVFMLQGVSFGFVERGCYSIFHAYWRRRHSMLILFYIAMALGATISPLITSSFFVLKPMPNESNSTEQFVSQSTMIPHKRQQRNAGFENSTLATFCNETSHPNCTGSVDFNGTTIMPSPSPAPKVIKPQVNDATDLDHQPSKTEKKVNAQDKEKQNQQPAIPMPINAAASGGVGTNTSASSTTTPTTTALPTSTTTSTTKAPATTTTSTTKAPTSTPVPTTTSPSTSSSSTSPSTSAASTTTNSSKLPRSSTSATATVPPKSIDEAWERMRRELEKLNSYQLSYVVVASISLVLTTLYALIFCFTPCRHQTTAASANGIVTTDSKLNLNWLWKTRSNSYAVCTTAAFVFLMVGLEAIMSNLLAMYGFFLDMSNLRQGIAATGAFWFCVSIARIVAATFHNRLTRTAPMATCMAVALFATGVAVVFNYWTVVWIVASVLGFSYGCLYPLTYCWLDQQLTPGPWFATVWCISGQLARLTTPYLTSSAMVHHSPKDFLFALLVTSLLMCITFVFMRSTVRESARLLNVEQQKRVTCKVKFGGGDTVFEYQHFDHSDGLVDRDGDDEITYFDRSRDSLANGGTNAPLYELNPRKFNLRH